MPANQGDYLEDAVTYPAEDSTSLREAVDVPHPAAAAIDEMITAYGGVWPPRPQFSDWPESWRALAAVADDMPRACHEINDAAKFRQWMRQQLKERVDLPELMKDLESRMRTDDPVFFGFMAPLVFMVNMYRWGTIPPTDEERMRRVLEFPDEIWKPFAKLSDFWGLVHRGSAFTLAACNCQYENEATPDIPTDMRFCFNYRPEMIHSEKNFFQSFLHMENTFRPGLLAIRDFIKLTEVARKSREDAERVLAKRVELLGDVRKSIVNVSRVFFSYMKDHIISSKDWADYVQSLPAWNMNGIDGGASGGESLTFHAMDEFLGCDGQGVIYTGGKKKREGIPRQYVKVINALRDFGRDYRFSSCLDHDEKEDPVMAAKDDVLQMLYTWRLGHAKVAPRYLLPSRMTSGGSVDKVIVTGETLASRGEWELRERARETAYYMTTRAPPPSVLQHIHMGKRETEPTQAVDETAPLVNSYSSKIYDGLKDTVVTLLTKLNIW